MNENFKEIAELLPEGLTESAINDICSLVDRVIVEQVEEKVSDLEMKVHGFIRFRVDELKEQALNELNSDEELFRNAKIYEQIKSLMAIELTDEDDETALANIMRESHEVADERDLVIDEFNKSLHENEKLENTVKILSDRLEKVDAEKKTLVEEVEQLQESKGKPFKSSEQAKMITADVDQPQKRTVSQDNMFLTEEVMKFMPFNS